MCFVFMKFSTQQQNNNKTHKNHRQSRESSPEPLTQLYDALHLDPEITEHSDISQASLLLYRYTPKLKQTEMCGPHYINNVVFSVIFQYERVTIFGTFPIVGCSA